MVRQNYREYHFGDTNSVQRPPDFHWDETIQGVVLSSFYYGYIVSHIPGGVLADRFGGKHTLGLGILSTALTTLLTPTAAYLGPGYLVALRIVMGLGEVSTHCFQKCHEETE